MAYAASGLTTGLDDKPKATPKFDAKIDYGDIVGGDERMSLMELTGRPMEDMIFTGYHGDMGKRLMEVVSEASKIQSTSVYGQKMSAGMDSFKEYAEKYPNLYGEQAPFADMAWFASAFVDDMGGKLKLGSLFTIDAIAKTVKDWMYDLALAVQKKFSEKDEDGNNKAYKRMASFEDFLLALMMMSPSDLRDSELGNKYNRLAEKAKKDGANGNSAGAKDPEAEAQEAIRKTKEDFLKTLLTIVKSKMNMFSTDTKREGNFGKTWKGGKAEQIWNQLQAWKTQKKSIVAGTQDDSWFGTMVERKGAGKGQSAGEQTIKGLAGGHAYSVMGTRERGDHRYVLIRNPWGKTGREYVIKPDGKIDAKAVEDIKTCGIFLVEINDFALNFQRISAV